MSKPPIDLGVIFTSNSPVAPRTAFPTAVTNGFEQVVTWAGQHTFNYGGDIGDHRTSQVNGVWQWTDWTSLDVRLQAMVDMNIAPSCRLVTLHGAPVWCTGANDYDYASTASVPPIDDAQHRRWLADWAEMVFRHCHDNYGVITMGYYNEMKGYWSNALNNWDWDRYLRDYNAIADRIMPLGANMGGPYVALPPRQASSSGEVRGPWGDIDPRNTDGVKKFLQEARGFGWLNLDLTMSPNGNPNSYSTEVLHDYFFHAIDWARDLVPLGQGALVLSETYGDWTTAGSFTDVVKLIQDASGGCCVINLWHDPTNPVNIGLVNSNGTLTSLGQECAALRAAGIVR